MSMYGNNAIYLLSDQPDDVKIMENFLENNRINKKKIKTDSFRGLK